MRLLSTVTLVSRRGQPSLNEVCGCVKEGGHLNSVRLLLGRRRLGMGTGVIMMLTSNM
jgi:hypothetical protein